MGRSEEMNRVGQCLSAFIKSILVIIWFYLASAVVANLASWVCGGRTGYNIFLIRHSNLMSIIIYGVIFIGIYLVDKRRSEFIQSFRTLSPGFIGKYLLMGLGAYFIGIMITNLLIGIFPDYNEIGNTFTEYEPVLRFIGMVVLPPIVEEYLFRFKIQGYLKEGFGPIIAIIGQAVLFGMLHYYVIQKIYAIVLGIAFGYIREKKGNIQCGIWMHMTVNLLGWIAGCFFLA